MSDLASCQHVFDFLHACLRAPEHRSSPHDDRVLLRVIGSLLRGNFEDGRHCLFVCADHITHLLGDVLRDEDDTDVFAADQLLQELADLFCLSLVVDDQEVGLVFFGALTNTDEQHPRDDGCVGDHCHFEGLGGILFGLHLLIIN